MFTLSSLEHFQVFLNCYHKDSGKIHQGTLFQNVTTLGAVMQIMALLSMVAYMSTVIKTKNKPLPPKKKPPQQEQKNKQQNLSSPIETMKKPAGPDFPRNLTLPSCSHLKLM